jgi:hypothetical protein
MGGRLSKATLNKYVQSQSLLGAAISANPLGGGRGILNNYSRRWSDVNADFVVDCDVSNPQPNLECTNEVSTNVLNVTPTVLTDASVRIGWDRPSVQLGVLVRSAAAVVARHWRGCLIFPSGVRKLLRYRRHGVC